MSKMKSIIGYDGYQVFEDGSILGRKGELLRPWVGRGGYLKVCISKGNRETRRWVYVHRLVCEVYHGVPSEKMEINHKDGNKHNNNVSNLEWATKSENGFHAFRTGLNKPAVGERSANHKLTAEDVLKIRSLKGVCRQKEIRKIYGISIQHISNIQLGKFWKHLPEVSHV